MTARKTYPVEKLKERVNNMIARAATPEARTALASLLEGILMEAGAYKGFGYLDWNKEAHERWVAHLKSDEQTTPAWRAKLEELREEAFGDETRKEYY